MIVKLVVLKLFLLFSFIHTIQSKALNFTLDGNHLLPEILSTKYENLIPTILNHGCWCARLKVQSEIAKTPGGTPVDEMDRICRSWSMCNRCVKVEGFCESSRKTYFVVNTGNSQNNEKFWSCEFPQPDFCSKERCVCDLDASLAMFDFLEKSDNSWNGVSGFSRNCDAPNAAYRSVAPVQKNRCCKLKTGWVKYDDEVHSCDFDNEELVEVEMVIENSGSASVAIGKSKGNKKKTRRVKTSKNKKVSKTGSKNQSKNQQNASQSTKDQLIKHNEKHKNVKPTIDTKLETQIESPIDSSKKLPIDSTTVPITELFDYHTMALEETTEGGDYYEEAYKDLVDSFADWWQKPLFG